MREPQNRDKRSSWRLGFNSVYQRKWVQVFLGTPCINVIGVLPYVQAFRASDYKEASHYYTRSLSVVASAPAYNNRSLASKSSP